MTSRARAERWLSVAAGLGLACGCLEIDDRAVVPPGTAGGSGGSAGSLSGAGGSTVSPSAGGSTVSPSAGGSAGGVSVNPSGGSTSSAGVGGEAGAGGTGAVGGEAGAGGTAGSGGTMGSGGSTAGQGGMGGAGGSGGSNPCGTGRELCSEECVDLDTDEQNCGSCGTACADQQICSSGECGCPAELPDACTNTCVDFANDVGNCGGCGRACGVGDTCACGQCLQVRYDFEGSGSGLGDWVPNQDYVEQLMITSDQAYSGVSSVGLTVSLDASSGEDGEWRYFQVLDSDFALGDTLSIRAWVTAPYLSVAPVVQPLASASGTWGWVQSEAPDATPGRWETYCVEVPEDLLIDGDAPADGIGSIGFRVGVWGTNTFDGTVYIDTVAW